MENAGGKRNQRGKSTQTAALLHAYLERGDITARDRLVELYLPLVESFAHRYERNEDYDDLFQAGCIGLINAIDRFDLNKGGELAAFAVPNVIGEIKRHLRDRTASVRVPRPMQELRARAIRCEAELSSTLQRRPTSAEVARKLGVDKEDVVRALAPRRSDGEQADASLGLGTHDALDVTDERLTLASAFEVLDERERQIIFLRFVRDRSRTQVAQELGISERHLSRQTHGALAKLRDQLERAGQETAPGERLLEATARPPSRPVSRGPMPRQHSPKTSSRRPGRNREDRPYGITIARDRYDPEGHEWTARADELPGCQAHGDTVEEAVLAIGAAIDEWIEDALARGRHVPDPRTSASYSGRLMLRLPRSLHAELSRAAERQEVSLNQFIATSIERALDAPAVAQGEVGDVHARDRRRVPALLRFATIVNLFVVLVAGLVAVMFLVVASQQGW
jgi:RNA polymerase sigma-B factor